MGVRISWKLYTRKTSRTVASTKFHVSVSGGRRSRVPRTDLMEGFMCKDYRMASTISFEQHVRHFHRTDRSWHIALLPAWDLRRQFHPCHWHGDSVMHHPKKLFKKRRKNLTV